MRAARFRALFLLALSFAAVESRLSADEGVAAEAHRTWRDGPVRYLLTREDYLRYGKLKTVEARAAFAERFWKRWDPDPATAVNEFRERFRQRVAEADDRFGSPPVEGWRTDRGRVFIVLGEPDSVLRLGGDPNSLEREVWVYSRLPGRSGRPLEITFFRGRDGAFRLDPAREEGGLERDPPFPREVVHGLRSHRRSLLPRFRFAEPVFEALRGTASAPVERGRRGPARTVRAPSGTAPAEPLRASSWFFQAADGSVLALIALEVEVGQADGLLAEPGARPAPGSLVVVVEAEEAVEEDEHWKRPASRLAELHPVPEASSDGRLVFCGKVYLEPDTSYQIRYLVAGRNGGGFLLRSASLDAPLLGTGELSASSVVAAERFGPARFAEGSLFAIGSEEVVPRIGAAYHRGEPLRIYLQVYGATLSPETGRPRLDLVYRFERRAPRGFRRQGATLSVRGASGQSLGLALPIGDWPDGSYRVTVEIRDRLSGQRTSAEGAFSILP